VVKVTFDLRELTDWGRVFQLQPRVQRKVIARTINHVGDKLRTSVTRGLAKATGLPYGRVRTAIKTERAHELKLRYELEAKSGFFSLRVFGATPGRRGVSARPWGVRRVFRGTFIGPGGQVFKRTGEGRIRKLWGPSIPVEMFRDQVPALAENELKALAPRLAHEIERALPARV